MPSQERTRAACLQSVQQDYAPDHHGWQRWTVAEEAKRHLVAMTPERRAQLEREWRMK